MVQTYQPEHYSIQAAIRQDYPGFYEEEAKYRQLLSYPPMSNLICHSGRQYGRKSSGNRNGIYKKIFEKKWMEPSGFRFIGPADEPVAKVADMYRKVLYVKQEDLEYLLKIKERLERYIEINSGFKNIRIQFDFNH